MFKRDHSWINDYIENATNNGHALIAGAFRLCLDTLNKQEEEIIKLRRELGKYKPRKRKIK